MGSKNELKKILFDAYGGFSDRRIQNLDRGRYFTIDDRGPSDEDARGALYSWFCQILVEVVDQDSVKLTMRGSVPNSPAIAKWFEASGSTKSEFGREIPITRDQEGALGELASLFRAVVRPGARYEVASYKHVCPRAADSLDRLRHVLSTGWGD